MAIMTNRGHTYNIPSDRCQGHSCGWPCCQPDDLHQLNALSKSHSGFKTDNLCNGGT